ncbi:MAG: peptidoglycan-binding domain-containing protein [Cellvibrio sp.]|uniref:peptidoglycan-binding domain-containing protein n=1 Tax=Cellvibrio sp. TaxID=1965322 RepID=UPI0031A6B7CB
MTDAIRGTIVASVFALAGALGGAAVTGWSQVQLAKQKFNSDLVLKALESGDPSQRLESLRLLIETNLIQDPEIKKGVREYAKSREAVPESIPQIMSVAQVPTKFKTARDVQEMLKALGYYTGQVEDFYTPEFRQATQTFQQEHGLTPDGQIGAMTLRIMTQEYEKAKQAPQ